MVISPPRLWPLTDCTTNYKPVLSSERVPPRQRAKQFSSKRKDKVKSCHGPQRGARHEDILTDFDKYLLLFNSISITIPQCRSGMSRNVRDSLDLPKDKATKEKRLETSKRNSFWGWKVGGIGSGTYSALVGCRCSQHIGRFPWKAHTCVIEKSLLSVWLFLHCWRIQ
jgi:hypothetical protein